MISIRFAMRARPGATGAERFADYQAALDMVEWVESQGCLEAVGLPEHHSSPDGYLPSPMILASAVAARTKTAAIRIIALLPLLYEPVRLAEDLAVLDLISGGRVMCVLGMGYRDEEYELFGVDKGTRPSRMQEAIDVLRQAWTGEPFDHPTRGSVMVRPRPGSDGGVFLLYGGHSVAAAKRAARNQMMFVSESDGEHLEAAYHAEAERVGVPAMGCVINRPGAPTTVFVADDLDEAWSEIGPAMLREVVQYREWNASKRSAVSIGSTADTVDELRAEQGAYRIFTRDEAAAHVAAGNSLAIDPLCGGLAPEVGWRYLRMAVEATRDGAASAGRGQPEPSGVARAEGPVLLHIVFAMVRSSPPQGERACLDNHVGSSRWTRTSWSDRMM